MFAGKIKTRKQLQLLRYLHTGVIQKKALIVTH